MSDESQLVFTSNRGEDTIGVFAPGPDPEVTKIAVGMRPNGLAYDAKRRLVLAANVGDPAVPHSYTLSMVDLDARALRVVDRGAGPNPLDGVRCRRPGLLRQHHAALRRSSSSMPAQPDRVARTIADPG